MSGATIASSPLSGINVVGTYTFNPGVTNIIYTVTDNSGNSTTCPFTVTVPPPPEVSASSNSPICYDATLNLSSIPSGGTTPFSFSWSGPDSFSSSLQNPSIPNARPSNSGTYTITITDANGCDTSTSIEVIVYEQLTNPGIMDDQVLCDPWFGPPSDPDPLYISIPVTGGSEVYSYQWQYGPSDTGPWTDIIGAQSTTYSPTTTEQFYRLEVTNICGTVYSNSVEISTTSSSIELQGYSVDPTGPYCPGEDFNFDIEILARRSSGRYIQYIWSADSEFINPSTGGPVGVEEDCFWFIVTLCYYRASINFTVNNSTDSQVTTTITVSPIIYNSNGTVYCELTSETYDVTIRPIKLDCIEDIEAYTSSSSCDAQVSIPNFTWVSNSCTDTIHWTMSGATTGSDTGNIGTKTFNLGTTNIYYYSTLNGDTTDCSFTVTVIDDIDPTITCPVNINVDVDPGSCEAAIAAALLAPQSYDDNCGVTVDDLSWTITDATTDNGTGLIPETDFGAGISTVKYIITDQSGNADSCTTTCPFTVTVPPNFTYCPDDYTINTDPDACYAFDDPPEPVVTDNCLSLLSLEWTMTGATTGTGTDEIEFTDFNEGATLITYIATDAGGIPEPINPKCKTK